MKKIVFYIFLLSGSLILSCSEDSGSENPGDYINPGFTAKDVSTVKAYSGFSSGCTGSGCKAIIYSGKVNNIRYAGIAVKESSYNFKIYWPASSIITGTPVTLTSCTVKQNNATETDVTVTNVTFTNNNDTPNTYTVLFADGITSPTITIAPGSSITGQFY